MDVVVSKVELFADCGITFGTVSVLLWEGFKKHHQPVTCVGPRNCLILHFLARQNKMPPNQAFVLFGLVVHMPVVFLHDCLGYSFVVVSCNAPVRRYDGQIISKMTCNVLSGI